MDAVPVKGSKRRAVGRGLSATATEAGKEVAGSGHQILAVLRRKGEDKR